MCHNFIPKYNIHALITLSQFQILINGGGGMCFVKNGLPELIGDILNIHQMILFCVNKMRLTSDDIPQNMVL